MDMVVEQRRKKRAHNATRLVDLPENCIFDILVRLPLETLCSSRFVCKSWFEIIISHDFRDAHLHRSDTTTPGLIFLSLVKNFMVYIKSMEFNKDGNSTIKDYKTAFNGKIIAACNGLIVLERNPKTAGLILSNPVTREDEDIPIGTISSSQHDSYGLAFCHVSRRYKLLHLFRKGKMRNIGCEIMDIGSGSWRAVDVPPTERHFIELFQNPIFAMGALHWIQDVADRGECMVSMTLDDEKFKITAIPETGRSYFHCKSVFAMGEFVGYASRLERFNPLVGVWILRGLGGECGWEKQYNIDVASGLGYLTTLLCYGGHNGHVFIFTSAEDGCLYAYDDRHSQQMRKIEDIDNVVDTNHWGIFPHVNSLVSWRS